MSRSFAALAATSDWDFARLETVATSLDFVAVGSRIALSSCTPMSSDCFTTELTSVT